MRIIERTSRWAKWASRFANYALPLAVLPVWLHRSELMTSTLFQFVFALASFLALFGILFGIIAYFRIWQTGDHGWGRASLAIIIGLSVLAPTAYGAYLSTKFPLTHDVMTNWQNPLTLAVSEEPALSSIYAPPQTIRQAFPGAVTRSYDLSLERASELVAALVERRQWKIVRTEKPDAATLQLNLLAKTLMGWQDEVVIWLHGGVITTRVDMRSISLNGVHDLGTNGRRIEAFLADLDALAAQSQKHN